MGDDVSVDHIFCRSSVTSTGTANGKQAAKTLPDAATQLGYLDSIGTRIVRCQRGDLSSWFNPPNDQTKDSSATATTSSSSSTTTTTSSSSMISDHVPVTTQLIWPSRIDKNKRQSIQYLSNTTTTNSTKNTAYNNSNKLI